MKKNDTEKVILFTKKEYVFIGFLIFLSIFSPVIFKNIGFFSWMNLGKTTAEIGDAIGGISAPFIGVLAAFLVYKSFEAQIRANKDQLNLIEKSHNDQMKIITQEMSYNFFSNIIEENLNSFKQLKLVHTDINKEYIGVESTLSMFGYYEKLMNTKALHTHYSSILIPYLEKLLPRIESLEMIVNQLNNSDMSEDYKIIKRRFLYSFIYELLEDFQEEFQLRIQEADLSISIRTLTSRILKSYNRLKVSLKETSL